jgi:hypothetical protein
MDNANKSQILDTEKSDKFDKAILHMNNMRASNMQTMWAEITNKLASLTASQTEPAKRQTIINQDSQQTYPENDQYEHSEGQDPYILDLQDKEGYDSDGKSVRNQTVTHTVSHTVSKPPPELERITRPISPGSSQCS